MATSIHLSSSSPLLGSLPMLISNMQNAVSRIFEKTKEVFSISTRPDLPAKQWINLGVLADRPGEVAEGAFWAGLWGLSFYFAADSFQELYRVYAFEDASEQKFEKIGSAVKTAFVDVLSLGSSTSYAAKWADSAEIVSLGAYLPIVKNLCYGFSLVGNGIEAGADLYNIWVESRAVQNEYAQDIKEEHQQRLIHSLIKLIGNVSMVAWASLGIAALGGMVVSSFLSTLLLTVGCVAGVGAFYYKMHLNEPSEAALEPVSEGGGYECQERFCFANGWSLSQSLDSY